MVVITYLTFRISSSINGAIKQYNPGPSFYSELNVCEHEDEIICEFHITNLNVQWLKELEHNSW